MWGTKIKDLPFKLVVQSEIEIWRAADFWVKEPETIAWIDSFEPNSVFWDIGANIGVFSLYASIKHELHRIVGFEPCFENHLRMIENFSINSGLFKTDNEHISHKQLAFSDFEGEAGFYVPKLGVGLSGGQICLNKDEYGNIFNPKSSYSVSVTTIDVAAGLIGVPNNIKIDVDGHEWRILQGGNVTLQNSEVKSVLVEVNNCFADIDGYMRAFGFTDFNRFNGPDINRRANQKQRNVIYVR